MTPTFHRIAFCISLAFAFAACTKQLGTVGSYSVSRKELVAREKIIQIYSPDFSGSVSNTAKTQLINAFTYAEILKNNGAEVSDQALMTEAERIQKASLMPEKLQQIKDVFHGDEKAYRKIYVLPVYVERTLYFDFFLRNPGAQAEAASTAKSFLESAMASPAKFQKLAKPVNYFRFTVSLEDGLAIQSAEATEVSKDVASQKIQDSPASRSSTGVKDKIEAQKKTEVNAEAQRWIQEIARNLKPGDVFPQLIDQREQFWVVRLLRNTQKSKKELFLFEAASFPKADFQKWLQAERAKVKVDWN